MSDVVAAIDRRTAEVVAALAEADLDGASRLPGWSRLTIACHLRYGARAVRRMLDDVAAGRPTAYYPGGRAAVRDATLVPAPGEDVVASLREESDALSPVMLAADWSATIVEPPGEADLGPIPVRRLVLGRLTEVEVHGTDLGLGLADWSDLFVRTVLPDRVAWLPTRRTNHRAVDPSVRGSWLLRSPELAFLLTVHEDGSVTTARAEPGDAADAVIEGSGRDLLALLLGRPFAAEVRRFGPLADAFERAFPGP